MNYSVSRLLFSSPLLLALALPFSPSALAEKDPDLVAVSAAQLKQLGIESQKMGATGGATQTGLSALVVVPNAQLRVVTAPLPGLVEALLVAPGMTVKAGQAVVRLASPQALELQRDLRQTSAQSDLARHNLTRDEMLFKEGLIAESRLQASRAAAAQAEAAAGERRQSLALAGGQGSGSLILKSPIDGVVLEQTAGVGQRVDPATPIYKIGKLSPLWLEIQVPAELAAHAREGMAVRAEGARGRLISVGRAVASPNQTVTLRALLTDGLERLRPGQAVAAELDLPAGSATTLPASALVRGNGRSVVFVQTEGGFRATTVQVGRAVGDTVQAEGIKPGATVAVKGVSGLKAIWTGVGRE